MKSKKAKATTKRVVVSAIGCLEKNRFAFDNESGFVIDRETGEWLTTAEEVFDAMIQHMPNN